MNKDFWKQVLDRCDQGQRYGQAVFNTAAEHHSTEAERLRGSEIDPFYDSAKTDEFLGELYRLIDEGEKEAA